MTRFCVLTPKSNRPEGTPIRTLENPTERFTYGDYRLWPEDERWELIDGKGYDTGAASPAESISNG
jgi:hypothetical protein